MTVDAGVLIEHPVWLPVLIFLGRVTDVSIGTVRLICVTRGRRKLAVILGFFEVLIWLLAISGTFAHLDRWINVLAYAAGFATGNAVGMWIEKALAMGTQIVQMISRGGAHAVAERLRFGDMAVTTVTGHGRDGPVAICLAIVPRRATPGVIEMAKQIDPDVLVTVEDTAESSLERAGTGCPGKIPFKSSCKIPLLALLDAARQRPKREGKPLITTRAA